MIGGKWGISSQLYLDYKSTWFVLPAESAVSA